MATESKRPTSKSIRRQRKYNPARKYALPVFLCASLLVGLLVFGLFALFDVEDMVEGESTEPVAHDTVVFTPAVTVPSPITSTEKNLHTIEPIPEPDSNDNGDNKQPSSVSYAVTDSSTVALGDSVKCESVILIDILENTVVASKSSSEQIYPASLTKVMTLITAYDYIEDPYTERFTMTQDILEPLIISGNSLAGFEVGESSPLIDYMYGMIMFSGADAAEGIAVHCSGSIDAFVDAMNRKAKEIGLKNSHFTNPVGEHDDEHYSTVHDMALILGYAYEIDILAEILNTYTYTSEPTSVHPDGLYWESNLQQRMVGDESGTCQVLGGKTGYTNAALHCVMTYARSNKTGKCYLFVATGGSGMYDPIWDCINTLKDYVE